MRIGFQSMSILLYCWQLFFDSCRERIQSDSSRPQDEAARKEVFCDFPVGILGRIGDLVFFEFGNAGVGDDIYLVLLELLLGVFADLFVVGI